MTEQHPITPPPELVQQWCYEGGDEIRTSPRWYQRVCAKAARWGYEQRGASNEAELQKARDQELEACCEHLQRSMSPRATIDYLRAARRPKPKPPSLKEQALKALDEMKAFYGLTVETDTIRRALESLPS